MPNQHPDSPQMSLIELLTGLAQVRLERRKARERDYWEILVKTLF